MAKSKNDECWEKIFEIHKILECINNSGFFVITAPKIKEFREPRLMTKFDSKRDLPKIFKDNNLAILPIKRGEYIIGKFKNYEGISIDNSIAVDTKYLPDYITTIDYSNVTSEAISLNTAFISGMISDLIDEEVLPTIQGRMGTGIFDYKISTEDTNEMDIKVENSQMEIDGSYEGLTKFVIVEAKNHFMEDFIVRQLYYPYRVWRESTHKEVIPVMLIKHDNIYNFFVYEFQDEDRYNSIKLLKIKRYILDEIYREIELSDLENIYKKVVMKDEPLGIPFPQADSFFRVLDFMNNITDSSMNASDVSELYEFDTRQGSYYISAAKYLGFVDGQCGSYSLTDNGKEMMKLDHKKKNLRIVEEILSHKPFYQGMGMIFENHTDSIDLKEVAQTILDISPDIKSDTTAYRRAQTVQSWVRWILNLSTMYENSPYEDR